jgi:hypothetical protein
MVEESGGWNDAARKQPTHGRSVLALLPMDNVGYTEDAGHKGTPRAWVIARWNSKQTRWHTVDPSGSLYQVPHISLWRELPPVPEGVLIVPPAAS